MEKREAGSVLGSWDVRSSAEGVGKLRDQPRVTGASHVCRVEAYGAKVVAIASGFGEARPIPSITSVSAALAAVACGMFDLLSTIDPLRNSQLATPVDTTALWCDGRRPPAPLKTGLPRVSGTDPLLIPLGGTVVFAIAVWFGSTGHGLGISPVVAARANDGSVFDACVAASITPLERPSTRIRAQLDCAVIRGQSDLFRASVEEELDPRPFLTAHLGRHSAEPVLLLPVSTARPCVFETGDIIIASSDSYSTAACTVRCEPEKAAKDK